MYEKYFMPSLDEIRELLKQMTEEQRLELIRLCNLEITFCAQQIKTSSDAITANMGITASNQLFNF